MNVSWVECRIKSIMEQPALLTIIRALQAAAQYMQAMARTDVKRQTMKLSSVNDSLLTLGRFLFDHLLPPHIQDALRHLDTALIIDTNTPEIPWELLFEGNAKTGRYLCQHVSVCLLYTS